MRVQSLIGIILSFSLLVLSSLWLRAQQPISPHPRALDAVWVAHGNGLYRVSAHDAAVLSSTAEGRRLNVVAADTLRGVVWAYGEQTLWAYRLTGERLHRLPLGHGGGHGDEKGALLQVNPDNGSVWLALKERLYHVGARGAWLGSHRWPDQARALAWDPTRSCLWVATKDQLSAITDAGVACAHRDVGEHADIRALAVDPDSGVLWVAMKKALRAYAADGTLRFELPADQVEQLASDYRGGVWGTMDRTIFRLDSGGHVLVAVEPFDRRDKLVALEADPKDASVWVATTRQLKHHGPDGREWHHVTFKSHIYDLALYIDGAPPTLSFTAPHDGDALPTNTPRLIMSYADGGSGVDRTTLVVWANDIEVPLACEYSADTAACTPTTPLPEGAVTLTATITDYAGHHAAAPEIQVTIDTMAPVITLTTPADGSVTNQVQQVIAGTLNEAATLTVNGATVLVTPDLTFTHGPVSLQDGLNTFELIAIDAVGQHGQKRVQVALDTTAPTAVTSGAVDVREVEPGHVQVSGPVGSVEVGARVTLTNTRTGQVVTVIAGADGSFTASLAAQPGDVVTIVVADEAGNASPESQVPVSGALPPDPASIAPPLDRSVATDLATATAFLYSGGHPIQTGVAPETIEPRRIAVLRGQVKSREETPLPGVTITILGHPEFGQTLTRADGLFDLAVNGGGVLTVRYEKDQHMPVQRQVQAPWRDYAWLPDVVMLPYDPYVTTIDLTAATNVQVARGSEVTDESGRRQATLLFTPGTQATMVLPDGTTQGLSALQVRATEYTVAPHGPKAMPGALPPTSAYTYAVELSVDEAVVAGATEVRFTQPVFFYVDNFLHFPVGGIVPAGYYDRTRGVWVPSDNGRIVKVLAVNGGVAALDVDGDGTADEAAVLTALGITAGEQERLAALYQPGQSLWRVPIPHFTPWDFNWPFGPPPDAIAPKGRRPKVTRALDKPTCQGGSLIECQNQILGEAVRLLGIPFSLHYRSDRVPGRITSSALDIELSGPNVPGSLKRIELEIDVAGRHWAHTFANAPNQTYAFIWDGQDAYGRFVQGTQVSNIRVGYVYAGVYRVPRLDGASFGTASGVTITGSRTREEITVWQEWRIAVGSWDARAQGLGGWSANVHHAYDTSSGVLYLGDGNRRSADAFGPIITTVAGNGTYGASGDGGPALQAELRMLGVAIGPDNSLYIADAENNRIRRVDPDGLITTVAGNGTQGYGGDGGLATQARLNIPRDVAVGADGSLYISDEGNRRIRRVGPDGIIVTVAGNGTYGTSGDGGPAIQAQLTAPWGLAAGPDGSLYIADIYNHRIRRVGPDGVISTVAGNGTYGRRGEGVPAIEAQLTDPSRIALGVDGSLYVAGMADDYRVRRVGTDGIITTVAGDPFGARGDGGLATKAYIGGPGAIALGRDGSLYIVEEENYRIRRVGPDGIITTVAGNGSRGDSGDGGPATAAELFSPLVVAVGTDGSLYIVDGARVRRVSVMGPILALSEVSIPAENGDAIYVFDEWGRHLRTMDAMTGTLHYRFAYDGAGRLIQIIDGNGLTTTIEREGDGNPAAIVTPFGQRTALSLDTNGYLASLTNPAGDTIRFAYTADGLLTQMIDSRGNPYRFSYDPLGQLVRDEDPAGGSKVLTREDTDTTFSVSLTTALGRTSTYQVERLPVGGMRRVNTDPRGLQSVTEVGADGSQRMTAPDGTVATRHEGPDPRFGMQTPLLRSLVVTTPGGLTSTLAETRTVTLSNPLDPLSLMQLTATTTVNGRDFTDTYEAASRTLTSRTPTGRRRISLLDAQGRVLETQVDGLEPTRFTYDQLGRLGTIAHGSRTSGLAYNSQGYLASLTDPLGSSVGFAYDPAGRLLRQTLPDGREMAYAYDANGNLTSSTPPGRPSHAFTYTAVDLEAGYLPPELEAGPTPTQYTYNLDRQLVQVTRPDGPSIDLGYDSAGRLSMLTLPHGQLGFDYHPMTGNLASITAPDGEMLSFSYEGSLLTRETWSGTIAGYVQYVYDHDFRLTSQHINGDVLATFHYDADGLLTQAGALTLNRHPQHGLLTGSTLGNITDTRAYTAYGESDSYRATFGGTDIFAVHYERDPLGRIIQATDTLDGQTNIYTYDYDLAGRLTRVQRNGSPIATYAYDSNGNRSSSTSSDGTITGMYDVQDRLTRYGSTTYTYTANGDLYSKTAGSATTTYAYDALGNLTAVTLPNGTQLEYVIDSRNRRVGKKVNGILVQGWLYTGQLTPVAELDGQGNITARFVYGTHSNVPDYLVKGGHTYRILTDHLGSPRILIDINTGHTVQRMHYDTFGNVTYDDNPGFQPFGFAGGLYDPDTKLIRFGARDYDAETGRWTAKDPIRFAGGDPNLYGYVLNDPVNWADPWGLELISAEEGQGIVDVAKSWEKTPYLFGGKSKSGADCSGSAWAIYKEAGFPYKYLPSGSFPNSPHFRPSPDNKPQVGDIGRWNGHMVIYDPNAPGDNNVWTARHTGGPPYGPHQFERYNKIYGPVQWYRYDKPE